MTGVHLTTKDGRIVGTLKGKVLYKTVFKSKHYFNKIGDSGGWGIDYDVLFAKMPTGSSVYIKDKEEGILYMVTVGDWKEFGTVRHFKEGTTDHYTQVFLPVQYFNKVKQG